MDNKLTMLSAGAVISRSIEHRHVGSSTTQGWPGHVSAPRLLHCGSRAGKQRAGAGNDRFEIQVIQHAPDSGYRG